MLLLALELLYVDYIKDFNEKKQAAPRILPLSRPLSLSAPRPDDAAPASTFTAAEARSSPDTTICSMSLPSLPPVPPSPATAAAADTPAPIPIAAVSALTSASMHAMFTHLYMYDDPLSFASFSRATCTREWVCQELGIPVQRVPLRPDYPCKDECPLIYDFVQGIVDFTLSKV